MLPKAALSLQAAARQFMAKNSSDQKMLKHVILQSSCEIDKDCQTVLRQTYGHCNYPDILDLNLGSKKGNYCTVHGKFCKPPPTSSGRTLPKSSDSVVEFCVFTLFVHLSFKLTSLQWDIRASSRSGIDVNIAGAFLSCKAFSFCANAFQKPTWVWGCLSRCHLWFLQVQCASHIRWWGTGAVTKTLAWRPTESSTKSSRNFASYYASRTCVNIPCPWSSQSLGRSGPWCSLVWTLGYLVCQ